MSIFLDWFFTSNHHQCMKYGEKIGNRRADMAYKFKREHFLKMRYITCAGDLCSIDVFAIVFLLIFFMKYIFIIGFPNKCENRIKYI
jgi:hypothetical protein